MTAVASPTPTTRSRWRSVQDLLASEWIKVASLHSSRLQLGLTAVVAFGISWAVATFVTDQMLTVADVFAYGSVLTALLASVAGILLFTSEVQHGTLAAVLIAHPSRWVVVACQAATAVIYGIVLGAIGMVAGYPGAIAGGLELGDTAAMAATFAWVLGLNAIAAVLGLGIGMIVRGSAPAIAGLLAWWFVIENILIVVMPESSSRFLPYVAAFRMIVVGAEFESADALAVALSRPQATLVFSAYAVVAVLVGSILLSRRDAP